MTGAGRAGRGEFLAFHIGAVAILLVASGTAAVITADSGASGAIAVAAALPAFWFLVTNSVRRLHDLDKAGAYLLLAFVPIVSFGLLLYMIFSRGTDGANRFGPVLG